MTAPVWLEVEWLAVVLVPLALGLFLRLGLARDFAALLVPLAPVPALVFALLPPSPTELPWLLFGAHFHLDQVGRVFLFFTSSLWIIDGAFALTRLPAKARHRYLSFHCVTLAGNVGVIIAADVVTFYTFFALMTYAAYGLVTHDDTPAARRAGRVYLSFAVVGELFLLAGLFLTAHAAPTLSLADVPLALGTHRYGAVASALLFVGFGVKAGALLMHLWLPLAYGAAPAFGGAVLSGAMSKAGLLGWLRFLPIGFVALPGAAFVMALGFAAALYGVVVGLCQREPRTVLAYSSVSQMGLMTMIVGAGLSSTQHASTALSAAVMFALHHSLAKGALFLSVDAARPSSSKLLSLVVVALSLLPGLSLGGLVFTSGAAAKKAVEESLHGAAGHTASALAAALPLTSIATLLLMAWFWRRLFLHAHATEERPHGPAVVLWAILTLLSLSAFAFVPWREVPHFLEKSSEPSSLWSLTWPVLVALALIALATFVGLRKKPRLPSLPAGDLLAFVEPFVTRMWHVGRDVNDHYDSAVLQGRALLIALRSRLRDLVEPVLALDERYGFTVGATLAVALALVLAALLA